MQICTQMKCFLYLSKFSMLFRFYFIFIANAAIFYVHNFPISLHSLKPPTYSRASVHYSVKAVVL